MNRPEQWIRSQLARFRCWYLETAPWWALPSTWSYVWNKIKPDIAAARRALPRIREYVELVDRLEEMGARYPNVWRFASPRNDGSHYTLVVFLRIRDTLEDVRPFLEELLDDGWEVDKTSDSINGRDWKLVRPDGRVKLALCARIADGAQCEIVTIEVPREPEKRYELLCPGEEELVSSGTTSR